MTTTTGAAPMSAAEVLAVMDDAAGRLEKMCRDFLYRESISAPELRKARIAVAAMAEREAALRAEVEALRADAERYRHLRDWGVPKLCVLINGMPSYIDDTPQSPAGQKLDAAIDAARAEARDGK